MSLILYVFSVVFLMNRANLENRKLNKSKLGPLSEFFQSFDRKNLAILKMFRGNAQGWQNFCKTAIDLSLLLSLLNLYGLLYLIASVFL